MLPVPASADDTPNNKVVAFVGNWNSCPTPEMYESYTHIVLSFAVTYTWTPGKNICSQTCDIAHSSFEIPTCNNVPIPAMIETWQNQGIKVLLSFGGAGMGGSWHGDINDCWDYCFGREQQLVNQLTRIIETMGLDGIDIDYEYFYDDNQNGRGFRRGEEARKFLIDLTLGLRESLGPDMEISHAPMDADLVAGKGYRDVVLPQIMPALDFIMPQYYNGVVRSPQAAIEHIRSLVEDGPVSDPSKIVYGFCISECSSWNQPTAQGALAALEEVYSSDLCLGGAFFWSANADYPNGNYASTLSLGLNDIVAARDDACRLQRAPTPPAPPTTPPPSPPPTPTPKCVAKTQAELGTTAWATTDDRCAPCATGQTWWPCNEENPPLCNCGVGQEPPPPTEEDCTELFGTCETDEDCCDGGVCVTRFIGQPIIKVCSSRFVRQRAKTSVGNSSRGGSAARAKTGSLPAN